MSAARDVRDADGYAVIPGWEPACSCHACEPYPSSGGHYRPRHALHCPTPDDTLGLERLAGRCHGENGELAREVLASRHGWTACPTCGGLGRDSAPPPLASMTCEPDGFWYCEACAGSGLVAPPRAYNIGPCSAGNVDPLLRFLALDARVFEARETT